MFKKSIWFLVLLVPSMVIPFVSYHLLEKDGKRVLILGDAHNYQLNELNSNHFDVLKQEISQCNNVNKINCFVELRSEQFEDIKNDCQGYLRPNFAGAITLYKFAHECDNKQFFRVVIADKRSEESMKVVNVFKDIECCIKASQDQMAYGNTKLKKYIEALESNFEIALQVLETYKDSPDYAGFKQLVVKLKKNTDALKTKIGSYDITKSIGSFILSSVADSSNVIFNPDEFLKNLNLLRELFFIPNSLFADIGFLDYILKDQLEHDKTVICVGSAHAKNLNEALQQVGYRIVNEYTSLDGLALKSEKFQQIMNYLIPTLRSFMGIENKISDSSSSSFNSTDFLNSAISRLSLQENKEDQNNSNLLLCNGCNREHSKEVLKKCSRCKIAQYCSKDCQKNHWKAGHSKNCVAAK